LGLFQVNGIPLGTGEEYKEFNHPQACGILYGLWRYNRATVKKYVLMDSG